MVSTPTAASYAFGLLKFALALIPILVAPGSPTQSSDEQECSSNLSSPSAAAGDKGFELSVACAARITPDKFGEASDLLKDCPTHCGARLTVAKEQSHRLAKLFILSPRWNSTAGDPLLSYTTAGIQSEQAQACIKLVKKLAKLVAAEAKSSSSTSLFHRAMSYSWWVLEHERHDETSRNFRKLTRTVENLLPVPSVNLDNIDLWRKKTVSIESPKGLVKLKIKHISRDPRILVIDGVLSEQECEKIVAWQDAYFSRLPQPLVCIRVEDSHRNAGFNGFKAWAAMEGVECFDLETSSRLVSNISALRTVIVREGMGVEGDLFREDAEEPLQGFENFLSGALGLPLSQAGAINVVRYQPDGNYGPHFDCWRTDRQVTALMYLTETVGGETFFPELNKKVLPKCGRLLVFHNLAPDGSCDRRMLHEARPVKNGTKRILQRWYHDEVPRNSYSLRGHSLPPKLPHWEAFRKVLLCQVKGRALKNCRESPVPSDLALVQEREWTSSYE